MPPSPESFSPALHSVESLRLSIPESYQPLFDTLRREVIDFCDLHRIPTSSLNNDGALREATKHLSIPELGQLSLVLKRLEYLIRHKKILPPEQYPEFREAMEYTNEHYHLREQYTSQVSLLEKIGILKEGHIKAIDGKRYPVPTLEQIALRLFERRSELAPKHDQGFTKLLLVPFGMSLDTLREILNRSLRSHKKKHPDFELDIKGPLKTRNGYYEADTRTNPDGSPVLVYYPTSFDKENHQGKSKTQILEEQSTQSDSFPGWTIHLLQPSRPEDSSSLGIAPIPHKYQGKIHGQDKEDSLDPSTPSRPDIEVHQTPTDYLSLLTSSQHNPDSPYLHETGLTPEDWIIAFITHLEETGKPLDDVWDITSEGNHCFLIGAFFPFFSIQVPGACWNHGELRRVDLDMSKPGDRFSYEGSRFSVKI